MTPSGLTLLADAADVEVSVRQPSRLPKPDHLQKSHYSSVLTARSATIWDKSPTQIPIHVPFSSFSTLDCGRRPIYCSREEPRLKHSAQEVRHILVRNGGVVQFSAFLYNFLYFWLRLAESRCRNTCQKRSKKSMKMIVSTQGRVFRSSFFTHL